jgi:hypothetical protein
MELKARFLKVYSTLPLGARKEIVLSLDPEGPITWEVAYIEVENDTQLSIQILEKLELLGVI